jgi:hydroxymethylbilane synthase
VLEPETSLPAPGQGALAIECREDRADLREQLGALDHEESAACLRAERAVSRALSGSCQVPLGAYALVSGAQIHMRGLVAMPDGRRIVRAEVRGPRNEAERLGQELADALLGLGAGDILAALE